MAKARSSIPIGAAPAFKGTVFRGYRNYLEKRLDPSVRAAILEALRPEVRALLTGDTLLISSMYPIELQHEFVEVFVQNSGAQSEARLRAMGNEVAETDLTTIYRLFIWAASVPQTLSVLTKVWNSYFATGVARWKQENKSRGVIEITDRHHHPLHLPVVAGYIEVAIRLAGGKSGRVDVGPANGHSVPFICTWK